MVKVDTENIENVKKKTTLHDGISLISQTS